jgi:hypothetical protein
MCVYHNKHICIKCDTFTLYNKKDKNVKQKVNYVRLCENKKVKKGIDLLKKICYNESIIRKRDKNHERKLCII